MRVRALVTIALVSCNSFAQVSKYEAPCQEKVTAYYSGVSASVMEQLMQQCVRISEYEEKQQTQRRMKQEGARELDDLRAASDSMRRLNRLAHEKNYTDKEIGTCTDINSAKPLSASETDALTACLSAIR